MSTSELIDHRRRDCDGLPAECMCSGTGLGEISRPVEEYLPQKADAGKSRYIGGNGGVSPAVGPGSGW